MNAKAFGQAKSGERNSVPNLYPGSFDLTQAVQKDNDHVLKSEKRSRC